VIAPALAIGPVTVTPLPQPSPLVSVIAPCAPLLIPALVASTAFSEHVLPTISVCVPDAPPTVSDLTLTVLASWLIFTV
jgi:hypothetical protein